MNYMRLAAKLASHSHCHHRHGCVIVRRGHILGVGFNKPKTHPRSKSRSIHAELAAILNAGQDVAGASAFVVRINRRGVLRNSKPCVDCMNLFAEVGISAIEWSK